MTHPERLQQVLDLLKLTPTQERAAVLRGKDIIVTAGAGSGKTRTLTARYLALLAEGHRPQAVAAITFTEKAAREMRNRVRKAVHQLYTSAPDPASRAFWASLTGEIDGGRIGTIHSLCAELLRAHPAEAMLDPQFGVLDDNNAALLKADARASALGWAATIPEMALLFTVLDIRTLDALLDLLIGKRLELENVPVGDLNRLVLDALSMNLTTGPLRQNIAALRSFQADGSLLGDAGEKLAAQVERLLEHWQAAEDLLAQGDLVGTALALYRCRREYMKLTIGPRSGNVKETLKALQDSYDEQLNPWVGGKDPKGALPSRELEQLSAQVMPLVKQLYERVLADYARARQERRALDFDDLESKAHRLLQLTGVQEHWQQVLGHVLVDEFQDTNQRQRDIVLALAGDQPGKLFLVGDAQQSIYRFRGADVQVFVDMRRRLKESSGETLELDTTYRCHHALLGGLDSLLEPLINKDSSHGAAYSVPYLSMHAHQQADDGHTRSPYIEFVLGVGDAQTGRTVAARALAERLIAMKTSGEIQRWDDVALLFRASTGFIHYEDAFSLAGIPFLTVAGSGFYERPEIRDLLNILTVMTDPWNDTALAGLLRSPAVGLMDASLVALRGEIRPGEQPRSFYAALRNDGSLLPVAEQSRAAWALELLDRFVPCANQLCAADLLTRLVESLNYRAILMSAGPRLVRNVDKLLEEARSGEPMPVSAFLDLLRVSRDSGVRAGEAVSEASGSVQLMTIHKSKGLEFPLVVLADAAHGGSIAAPEAVLLQESGRPAGFAVRHKEPTLLYRYIRMLDAKKEQAETLRVLYVACTRASQKLLVSGYISDTRPAAGFLKILGLATSPDNGRADLNIQPALENPGTACEVRLAGGHPLSLVVHTEKSLAGLRWTAEETGAMDEHELAPLYLPLIPPEAADISPDEEETSRPEQRAWRAAGAYHAPAVVVGKLVHKALQRWTFPDAAAFNSLMLAGLIREGVVEPGQQREVLREVTDLLGRFQQHKLFHEITWASIRRHELAYAIPLVGHRSDTGVMDLLYRNEAGWHLLDFKTDEITSPAGLALKIEEYRGQMQRYSRACRSLLDGFADTRLCFLNNMGSGVTVYNMEDLSIRDFAGGTHA